MGMMQCSYRCCNVSLYQLGGLSFFVKAANFAIQLRMRNSIYPETVMATGLST